MSEYRIIKVRNGVRYMKDGKLVKKESVPQEVLDNLRAGEVGETPAEEPAAEEKKTDRLCLFCGAYTNWYRIVNTQTIAICQEHYYSETIGKIAQKLREKEAVNA